MTSVQLFTESIIIFPFHFCSQLSNQKVDCWYRRINLQLPSRYIKREKMHFFVKKLVRILKNWTYKGKMQKRSPGNKKG